MSKFTTESVLDVRHWSEGLFSFKTTRDPGLRFVNGQFVMLGLEQGGRPLLRAYSVASPNHEQHLGVPQHQGGRWAADLEAAAPEAG